MLSKIINFSIRNKLIVGLFVMALIGYGAYETTRLPIDAVPDITNNQVQVITIAPSFGATDIERLVTYPIEQANSNINGIIEIRSFSRFGLSLVTIVFDDATDIYWARQQVAERLQKVQAEIPTGIGVPEMGPITTGLGEIYQYVVRAKDGYEHRYDETELRTIQDWIVRRQLLGVDGVAEVSSFGGKLKQYEIAINPNKLQSYQLSIQDVFNALERNNQNTGGAYIEKGSTVLFIRSEGLLGSKEDIGNISVKAMSNGTPLLIKDIADINIGYATRYGAMCYNDKGEVAGAVVMMLKGKNASEVISNIKERVKQIQKSLPEGVVIEPFLDRTKMVNNAIGTVETNLIEGALIVLFVLILFLGNLRAGFLVASVIPLAMLFAIIMMNTFGVIGNLMSLGALDFGLIVDGAVFIVEAVLHTLTHSKHFAHTNMLTQKQMDEEVAGSSKKMARSVVFGQIIILIVYLPTFALQGIEGKMFIPMAQTVAFALLGAFLLSLTYVPMMSSIIMSKRITHKKNYADTMMEFFERHYQNSLTRVLNFPKTIITTALVLFAVSIFVLSRMGGEFIPALEEGDFAVDTRVLTGSSLNTTIEHTQKAAHILKTRFPEVQMVVTKIGSGEVPTDPMPMEASDMMVILKDKSEWTSAKTFPELSALMSKALEEVPGITAGFQFPVQMRFNELMTGARQDVVCKIFGENLDTLAAYAEQLGALVTTVEGTQNLYVEPITGMPQIIIEYKRAAIAQYNLSVDDVNQVVNAAFAGQHAGLVFEGERRFGLVVRLASDLRKNMDDVRNLLVPTPAGTQVPLYQLADVNIKDGPNQIQREDAKRRIVVGFNVRGRDVQSIVNELQQKIEKGLKLPAGYYITYGGAFENLNAAKKRLAVAVPVALFLIFILLFFTFNSFRQGLLIYSAIPLSAIGGIFFLALRGMPFSISAGVGFIALFGVAVLNGIVLVAEFNRLRESGLKDLHRIVIMGTKVRLRPVLMTAFVASLGFLPMALSNGAGAEVQRPLATVVIGGLMIATLLTLFVLPVLFIIFERKAHRTHTMRTTAIFIGLLFATASVNAQQPISLPAAIDSAMKNNLMVAGEKLRASYQKRLTGTAYSLPGATVLFDGGQVNSAYTDTRFTVSQSFSFPTVYARQKTLLNEEWKAALAGSAIKESEVRKLVSLSYYSIVVLNEKLRLLKQADSLYTGFVEKATLRFAKGESNILEKATAETQRGQIRAQMNALLEEKALALLQFNVLLNTATDKVPAEVPLQMPLTAAADSSLLRSHPELQWMETQQRVARQETDLEKARLLPDVMVGYANMSITGTGADNIYYPSSSRFQSAQIGLGIPLFFRAQQQKIKAAGTREALAANDYRMKEQELLMRYRSARIKYKTNEALVQYYESTALPDAQRMQEAADKQYANGDIDYLQWVMLANQVIMLRNNYLHAVQALNENIIEIQSLTSKL